MAEALTTGQDIVLNLYKRRSETPLQTIERYVSSHPEYKKARMTYAGRLDPMAEGVLVVLSGEKNKERDAYTGLDKDYEFEFILGLETDTFDILGKLKPDALAAALAENVEEEEVRQALKKYEGKIKQAYPPYSSKVVDGVPLFEYARRGTIDSIVLPTHEVEARELSLVGYRDMQADELGNQISKAIGAVVGDFRQKDILALWRERLESSGRETFRIFKARVSCGSGFYVRQLVADIGKDLGTGAVTFSILRTRVGGYDIKDSIR